MSRSFFQVHHMVIKRYGLSLSAFSTGRFGTLQERRHIADESGKGVIQVTAWGSTWLSGKGIGRQEAVTIPQQGSAHIARCVVPPGKPKPVSLLRCQVSAKLGRAGAP